MFVPQRSFGRMPLGIVVCCVVLGMELSGSGRAAATDAAPAWTFEGDIRPILKAHCFHCHGEESPVQGGLDLRWVRRMEAGGESGPAIQRGSAADSLIWQRIDAGEMPPEGKGLSSAEKAKLQQWLDAGAPTRRPEPDELPPPGSAAADSSSAAESWTEEERSHWSFQPIKRPPLPAVNATADVLSPIDAFLLAQLETRGLSYSPTTDRRSLIRRVTFDLTGLPPSAELVQSFLDDQRPDAYDRLVERLLASPAYGERWARHWLDVAGYADSDGYTSADTVRPWAFRYRDYVIRAFNRDLPLDRFVQEQLAGDELLLASLPGTSEVSSVVQLSPEQAEWLSATGFLRMAPDGTGEGDTDANVARNDVMAETLKIVTSSLLGLTVGCAQCHHHRYDPISQVDYYRMRAIFEPSLDWKNWREKSARLVSLWGPAERAKAAEVDQKLAEIEGQRVSELAAIVNEVFEREVGKLPMDRQELARQARQTPADQRTPEQLALLQEFPSLNVDSGSVYLYEGKRLQDFNKRYEELNAQTRAQRPPEKLVACLTEPPGHLPTTHVFMRGDFNQPRDAVVPSDLSVLGDGRSLEVDDPQLPTSGRRLAWARRLTDGSHPLVARVLVNRIWMHHFGNGLVNTPSDFGMLGERPSHPELLDWLVAELMQSGWQLKHVQRLLVTSRAYQQSAVRRSELEAIDPDNRLLGRMHVRRLEAEAIRDAMLEVAGVRANGMYGPALEVNPDDVGRAIIGSATRDGNGIMVAQRQENADQYRRTIYVQVRRSLPLGMLESLDLPAQVPNCDRRNNSTVPLQSLMLMNNDEILRLAQHFARRVARSRDATAGQIEYAWQLAYGRAPTEAELRTGCDFITAAQQEFALSQGASVSSPAASSASPAAPATAASPAVPGSAGEPAAAVRSSTAANWSVDSPEFKALALFCQAIFSSNRFLYVD